MLSLQGLIFSSVSLLNLLLGVFLFLKPAAAIERQRRFYAKINWRLEPISMAREIRNTKLMGFFLIVFTLGIIISYIFIKTQRLF